MPANYAHHRFGRQVLKTMPPQARQCVQRFRRMYDLGLHGPDIFFYYNPFWKTAPGELGNVLHRLTGDVFFPAACKAAGSEAAQAYLYGLLGHYCLDSHCHPYIQQLVDIGEAEHVLLESEFDRSLLVRDGEESPQTYDLSKKIHLTRGECMTVAEFYPGATGANISRSVKGMAFAIRFLANPRREKLLRKLGLSFADNMIPAKENEELALYVSELSGLYEAAREAYPRMLEQLLVHMESGEVLGEDFIRDFG